MQIPLRNTAGKTVGDIDLRDDVFGVPFNDSVVHQALVRQRNNARQGDAATKTRSDVQGSTRKLYAQKHTGRARQGSVRAPHRRGGGVVFGPHPRSYRQSMPRKMRHLALRSLLSAKAQAGSLVVVDSFPSWEQPRTKQMTAVLSGLGVGQSILLVTQDVNRNVVKSASNLSGVKTLPVALLNCVDLLSYRTLVMTEGSVRVAEELWAPERDRRKGRL